MFEDRRRHFLCAMGALAASPGAVFAQSAKDRRRIAVVDNTIAVAELAGPVPRDPHARAFVDRLRELGWIDGKNLEILWLSAEEQYTRRPQILADLVRQRVDAILVYGNLATREALLATQSIPIVMVSSQDPVRQKLVASLARPGGNVTGLDMVADPNLTGKRLAWLKQFAPGVTHVAFLTTREATPREEFQPETTRAAQELGLTLLHAFMEGSTPFESAFANAVKRGANGLHLGSISPVMAPRNQRLLQSLIERYRLPAAHNSPSYTECGAILNFGPDQRVAHERAAYFVDRILKGTKPSELPVERPVSVALVANVRAARAIGLTIPQAVLAQADRIIN